jgi:hypothetical protein
VKKEIKVTYIKSNDIIGLEDFCYNGNYIFTATCVSEKAEYFAVEHDV